MNKIEELKQELSEAEALVRNIKIKLTAEEKKKISTLGAETRKVILKVSTDIQQALKGNDWPVDSCFMEPRTIGKLTYQGFFLSDQWSKLSWEIKMDEFKTQVLVPIFSESE